jgi:hypothetical protein
MRLQQQWLKWEKQEHRTAPIVAFGTHVIPIERIVHLNWPGGNITWQRPVALEIQQGASKKRLPITHVTSSTIAGLALAGAIFVTVVSIGERLHTNRQRRKMP